MGQLYRNSRKLRKTTALNPGPDSALSAYFASNKLGQMTRNESSTVPGRMDSVPPNETRLSLEACVFDIV